jgi:alpha-L-arabinofuranosidase
MRLLTVLRVVIAAVAWHCAATAPAQTFRFDAAAGGPAVSRMLYGMNVARWDDLLFPTTTSEMLLTCDRDAIAKLRDLNPAFLKYPGGNDADSYIWNDPNNAAKDMDTEEFLWLARTCRAPGFFTVNFTQPPSLAAEWVRFVNVLSGRPGAVPYWEVGDEVWGHWAKSHTSGEGYGRKFRAFADAMRREDPTIKLAANLALASADSTWTREALRSLGDSFDIVTMTFFPLSPPNETDEALFRAPDEYRRMFRELEAAVAAASPGRPRPLYCLVGFNSTSTKPGPQTVQMANAVFMAQMFGALAETGTDMACWWAFHNAYSQRGGDYGVVTSDGNNTPHYTYWIFKLFSRGFHGRLLAADDDGPVEFYAVRHEDGGDLCLVLVNTAVSPATDVVVEAAGLGAGASALAGTRALDMVTSGPVASVQTLQAQVSAKQDGRLAVAFPELPGYSVSVMMLGEAALGVNATGQSR